MSLQSTVFYDPIIAIVDPSFMWSGIMFFLFVEIEDILNSNSSFVLNRYIILGLCSLKISMKQFRLGYYEETPMMK